MNTQCTCNACGETVPTCSLLPPRENVSASPSTCNTLLLSRPCRPGTQLLLATHSKRSIGTAVCTMEKTLPSNSGGRQGSRRRSSRKLFRGALALLTLLVVSLHVPTLWTALHPPPPHATAALSRCRSLSLSPGPSADFHKSRVSDRYVRGTRPYLLKNARIWTGAGNGTDVIHADILLDKGIIKSIGHLGHAQLRGYMEYAVTVDLRGAWVTPGYVFISPRRHGY